jgi:hypothetical protein
LSLRTLRRRLTDGTLTCASSEKDRNKTMICLDSIKNDIGIPLDLDDIELVKSADAGDPQAQNDLALLFLENNKPKSAIYWLGLAAKQDFADAMHLLGSCYSKGNGLAKDNNLALMWIVRRQLPCPVVLPHIIIKLLKSRHTSSDSASIPVVPHIFNFTLLKILCQRLGSFTKISITI